MGTVVKITLTTMGKTVEILFLGGTEPEIRGKLPSGHGVSYTWG